MGYSQQIIDVLNAFDPLFENFYPWLAGLYESSYGGFYYAVSSKADPEFQPDIESTGQAVHILNNSRLLAKMPGEMQRQLIAFFQQRQTTEGYFLDRHTDMHQIERMRARALMYSCTALEMLGDRPRYPLPGSQENSAALPDYLKSLAALEKWLNERPWDYAWGACDNIQATGVYLAAMPQVEAERYLELISNYLLERQDPQTGFWGGGRPYVKLSGAFKLALFYRKFNRPMPKAELLYQSVLEALRRDLSEDMCWTRNPIDLLLVLKQQFGSFTEAELLEILTITFENLKQYRKTDGGFSRHVTHSRAVCNEIPLGKGLAEGDMNASTQALRIRILVYQLADQTAPMSFLEDYHRDFYERVRIRRDNGAKEHF